MACALVNIMFKEILGEAFPFIEKFAPSIATVIASPIAGSLSALALQMIGHALGVSSDPSAIRERIAQNPECEGVLSQLESTFGDYIKNAHFTIKMPIKAELNLKLEWEQAQQAVV